MNSREVFGQCLQRVLAETGLSASEAARLVNFRSRTSIFRILSGDTSCEVDERFLTALHDALGDAWPRARWDELQEALDIKRMGKEQHASNRAFRHLLYEQEEEQDLLVVQGESEMPLHRFLARTIAEHSWEMIITGGCDAALSRQLVRSCAGAGDAGRLYARHYIDTDDRVVVQNILGVLPLMTRSWYNARLVDHHACPAEMLALYRVSAIILRRMDGQDPAEIHQLLRYDDRHFLLRSERTGEKPFLTLLDHLRYDLELLKPIPAFTGEAEAFLDYTAKMGELELSCPILSIKPDIHFNCVSCRWLEPGITEGLAQAGIADGPELKRLVTALYDIHDARFRNMFDKRSPTHLVYSLPAMKRFMETGVQTDHFFLQRAYTVEERRAILADLRDAMLSNPFFNVHFLKEDVPDLCNEITLYKGKGVLLMDAYSNYALTDDHSEALITHPAFMESFYRFFNEELLKKHVMPRSENLFVLDQLISKDV